MPPYVCHSPHFSGLPVCELQCRPVLCCVYNCWGPAQASFKCADGVTIEGALQIMCLCNGTYDTEQPNCGNSLII
ncbi:hypothetical protein DPMN_114320 [Dreissena polymorpha]|uniref:Uncharacterized protein n=1 Tax=Dreissena polymorpha TaxID=45954 RepID=A0A9D4KJ80_DREPO|nr:hypothetical protein DPMN_114320 [Dreissena polymorpha]